MDPETEEKKKWVPSGRSSLRRSSSKRAQPSVSAGGCRGKKYMGLNNEKVFMSPNSRKSAIESELGETQRTMARSWQKVSYGVFGTLDAVFFVGKVGN